MKKMAVFSVLNALWLVLVLDGDVFMTAHFESGANYAYGTFLEISLFAFAVFYGIVLWRTVKQDSVETLLKKEGICFLIYCLAYICFIAVSMEIRRTFWGIDGENMGEALMHVIYPLRNASLVFASMVIVLLVKVFKDAGKQ